MLTIAEVAETMQTILGPEANRLARTSGWLKRQRKLSGAQFVQTLVFGYLSSPSATRAELQQTAATLGVTVSRQALDQRCTEAAVPFLHQLLAVALNQLMAAAPVEASLLARFDGVYLLDSSVVTLPTALASHWPGCGGRTASTSQAALKLSLQFDLKTGRLDGLLPQPGRTHDRVAAQIHAPLPPGALRIADLGYFQLDELARMDRAGIHFITRYKTSAHLLSEAGQRLDLVAELEQQGAVPLDRIVLLGAHHRLRCRLVSVPVPDSVVDQRRQRLLAEAEDKQQPVSPLAWELARWTIYLTNVSRERLSLEEVLILGLCRWQIELVFKLWKSSGWLDEWRSHEPWHVVCELYAKLLALLIQHWVMLVGCWHWLDRSLYLAAQVIRKQALHLASVLTDPPSLCRALAAIGRGLAVCRVGSSRHKPSTAQRLRSGVAYLKPAHDA